MTGAWEHLERSGRDSIAVAGAELRAGSRVQLKPRPGGDVFDLVLAGRTAVIEAIEEDTDEVVKVAVVIEDDPGRDLGFARQPGHRFFFSPDELEPLGDQREPEVRAPRILLAGIGNLYLGDDGFGVELAHLLARRALPPGVEVVDYGIRGMDLAFAMQDGYDAVVLLDATPRGEPPGTLYVIEVDVAQEEGDMALDAHGMDPVKVIGLVHALGGRPPRTYVVGCEPLTRMNPDDEELLAQLSEPVQAALAPAVHVVDSLLAEIRGEANEQEVQTP
jgi:hydrogenase maturation protease